MICAASAEYRATAQGNREPFRPADGERSAPMTLVAVLGAGSWGTTLANLLAAKGDTVRIWAYEPEVVQAINRDHENSFFLPGVPPATPGSAPTAIPGKQSPTFRVIVSAAPSHAVRSVLGQLRGVIEAGHPGGERHQGNRDRHAGADVACSRNVCRRCDLPRSPDPALPARFVRGSRPLVVAAARTEATARGAQRIFATPRFRVYSHDDVIGVELAGALKNVIAIAAGILEGLGHGPQPAGRADHPRPGRDHPAGRGPGSQPRSPLRVWPAWVT